MSCHDIDPDDLDPEDIWWDEDWEWPEEDPIKEEW